MKKIVACGALVGLMALSSVASAKVANVDIYAGRMATDPSCFVQVDLKTVEEDMFNGQEKLRFGEEDIASFDPLLGKGVTLSAGKSVLFGSPAFAEEVGLTPDIELTAEACAKLKAQLAIAFVGSFGDQAGDLTTPDEYPALTIVGKALLVHLEQESFRIKSLTGEKEVGKTGGSSSGDTSSGGSSGDGSSSSSGGTSSGANTSGGSAPASTADDGGCSVTAGAPGTATPSLLAVGGIALAAGALRRRRAKR